MTPTPFAQLMSDLRASVRASRVARGLDPYAPSFEDCDVWTDADRRQAVIDRRAEARAEARRDGW